MKHMKRSNTYKNSTGNLTFNPETGEGYSYDWYRIVDRVGDQYVLNTYNYSPTTIKHVYKMGDLLTNVLGAHNVIRIEAPRGLQNLDASIEYYQGLILDLKAKIAVKGSHKSTNGYRMTQIEVYKDKIITIHNLMLTQNLKVVA